MKKIFLALAIGAMMLTACDKVDEYTSFAGAVGEWADGTSVADKSQRAFVEKYTGAKCVMCPAGDQVLNEAHEVYGDKLIAVAIDGPGSLGDPYNGEINTHTETGDKWAAQFGISTLPTALVNRAKENGQWSLITTMSNLPNVLESVIATTPKLAVAVESNATAEKAMVTANIEFLEEVTEPLSLTLIVIEDSIVAKQLTPNGIDKNYVHNHVLRDAITDLWGTDVNATGAKGECRKVTFEYAIKPELKIDNCHIIAMVSNKETLAILNSAICKL